MCMMELQSLRPPGELPAEQDIAAYEPHTGRSGDAEQLPGTPRDWTMSEHAWEEEDGALPVRCQESGECVRHPVPTRPVPTRPVPTRPVPTRPVQDQRELLRKLSALHLAEQAVPVLRGHRASEEGRMPPSLRSHMDARYPEPLSTEESPRRRARSLPWTPIPEVEDEDDPLLCCCKLKKRVQFADSLGLCLASVKHFLPSDEPLVPPSVLARLQSFPPAVAGPELVEDRAMPEGPVPAELLARLAEQRVCLGQVAASAWGVLGYVLVQDPGEGAQVKIRYTFNDWLSFLDCPASAPQESSAPGTRESSAPGTREGSAPGTQRFHFNLCYPPTTSLIHFAICFTSSRGQEIWDNNHGVNYTVSCQQSWLPGLQPPSPELESPRGPQQW